MRTRQRLVHFGAQVRSIRVALGMGQRALAGRIDRSQAYISLLERGNVPGLSIAEADVIARALGATLILGVEAPVFSVALVSATPLMRNALRTSHVDSPAGWIVRREAAIGTWERPGWVDILAFNLKRGFRSSSRSRPIWSTSVASSVSSAGTTAKREPNAATLAGSPWGVMATALVLATPRTTTEFARMPSACVRYFRSVGGT